MDKAKTQLEQTNCSLLTTTQTDTQSSNSSQKKVQNVGLLPKKNQFRWVIDHGDQSAQDEYDKYRFLSISQYYEYLCTSKVLQKQAKINHKKGQLEQEQIDDNLTCFCGRKYKLKKTFQQHIIQNHNFKVESVQYLHNKLQLENKYFRIAQLQKAQQTLLNRIKDSSLSDLFIPDELKKLFSQKQKQTILNFANQFIKDNSKVNEAMDQSKCEVRQKPKNFCFSEVFIQNIRKIAIKHVQVFNRRVSILLKNSSYKDVISLYIYNFIAAVTQAKQYKKIKTIVPLSLIIEKKFEELLNWVDHNYKKIFNRKKIFYQHIELSQGQKYTEVERINKKELFIKEFLLDTAKMNHSESKLINLQLLFQNFAVWVVNSIE